MNYANRIFITLAAIVLTLLATSQVGAFSLWPNSLPRQPTLYHVVGYLDRAPDEVTVRDRITIHAKGQADRELLIVQYGTPGETSIDLELSRELGRRYSITGTTAELSQFFAIPPGEEFAALFVAYTDGPPMLRIGSLEYPIAKELRLHRK